MEKLIACCGLNCAVCDARIATIKDDDDLRAATAKKWKTLYDAPDIPPETINCTGCREDGVKFSHCLVCNIRKCADEKGYNTCGDCSEMDGCEIVSMVHKHVPEAVINLRSLN